jgi:hypothetical protein
MSPEENKALVRRWFAGAVEGTVGAPDGMAATAYGSRRNGGYSSVTRVRA